MSVPTLVVSKWTGSGWEVPRPIYKVWWLQTGRGVEERYVVADSKAMAIRKAKRKWGRQIGDSGIGASVLIPKGVKKAPYAPPKVHLK